MARRRRKRRVSFGMVLDRDRGICKLNDSDRRQWINNDEGLYRWQRSERGSVAAFIKRNKSEIDRLICRQLGIG